jgi:hypothetical protein
MEFLIPLACGFGVAAGLAGVALGLHASPPTTPRPWPVRAWRIRTERMTVRGALAAACGLGVLLVTGWPIGALWAVVAALFLPRLAGGRKAWQGRLARTEAVATWAEMLRDTMAGAQGLQEAIIATAPIAPLAIRPQVRALGNRLAHDRLVPSLRGFADALADPTADLVAAALILASQSHAADLGNLLGSLAASARAQVAMELRVATSRARLRTSVRLITIFTLSFAGLLALLARRFLEPFDTPTGQAALLLCGLVFAAAFVVMDRTARAADPRRLLATAAGETP